MSKFNFYFINTIFDILNEHILFSYPRVFYRRANSHASSLDLCVGIPVHAEEAGDPAARCPKPQSSPLAWLRSS